MTRSDTLAHAGAAVATGAARFIPLPFVDDIITSFSRKQLFAKILRNHGRTFRVGEISKLYDDGGSVLGLPLRIVKGLILAPIKKVFRTVFFVFAIRDVALAMGKTIALAHTLDRALRQGHFRDEDTRAHRVDEARRLRLAFDTAYAKIDERIIRRAATALVDKARNRAEQAKDVEGFLEELDNKVDQALLDTM